MRLDRITVIGLLAAVTVACAGPVTGAAGPTAPAPGTPQLPPRPRELQIDHLDPCTTLTSDQLEILGVRFNEADPPGSPHGPSCYWNHSPDEPIEGYFIDPKIGLRVEDVLANPRGAAVTTVAGFPAVETQALHAPRDNSCIVLVSVAELEVIQSSYFYYGETVPMTRELACQKAKTAAEMAMQTILARAGG